MNKNYDKNLKHNLLQQFYIKIQNYFVYEYKYYKIQLYIFIYKSVYNYLKKLYYI